MHPFDEMYEALATQAALPEAYASSAVRSHYRTYATWLAGQSVSILPGPVNIDCPVRILQGGADPDVPWRHALELAQAIRGDDVVFSLIKDGDHRLSRPQDLARLAGALDELGA